MLLGDVTQFVGHNAGQFIGVMQKSEQAAVEKDMPRNGTGVWDGVLDDVKFNGEIRVGQAEAKLRVDGVELGDEARVFGNVHQGFDFCALFVTHAFFDGGRDLGDGMADDGVQRPGGEEAEEYKANEGGDGGDERLVRCFLPEDGFHLEAQVVVPEEEPVF